MDDYDNIIQGFMKSKTNKKRIYLVVSILLTLFVVLISIVIVQGIISNRSHQTPINNEKTINIPLSSPEILVIDELENEEEEYSIPEIELIKESSIPESYIFQKFDECGVEIPILKDSTWKYTFYETFTPLKVIGTGASIRDSRLGSGNDNPYRNLTIGCGISSNIKTLDEYYNNIVSYYNGLNKLVGEGDSFKINLIAKETLWNQQVYKVMLSGGMQAPTVNYLAIHSGLLYKITALGEEGNAEVNEVVDTMFKNIKFNKVDAISLRKTCTGSYYKIAFKTPINASCYSSDMSFSINSEKFTILIDTLARGTRCSEFDSGCNIEKFIKTNKMSIDSYTSNGNFQEAFGSIDGYKVNNDNLWITLYAVNEQNALNNTDSSLLEVLNSLSFL
jgi:hypothetical protein